MDISQVRYGYFAPSMWQTIFYNTAGFTVPKLVCEKFDEVISKDMKISNSKGHSFEIVKNTIQPQMDFVEDELRNAAWQKFLEGFKSAKIYDEFESGWCGIAIIFKVKHFQNEFASLFSTKQETKHTIL